MFRKKLFAYENSEGDKGVIVARSYKNALLIFQKKYPDRKVISDDTSEDYWDNGAYLFEIGEIKENELYNAFP